MKVHLFPTVMHHTEAGIDVSFPDIPGVICFGFSEEDAYSTAVETLRGVLEHANETGETMPVPSDVSKIVPISEHHVITLVHVII